jgi:hypothetical protein
MRPARTSVAQVSNETKDLLGLRDALTAARFDHDHVLELLGPEAHAALQRGETLPGLRATRGESPAETLVRLFLLQVAVPTAAAEVALPGLVDRLCALGVLEQSVAEVRARLGCHPYATEGRELWLLSDLAPSLDGLPTRVGPDHVLGSSSAARSLAQLTTRSHVARALDLGTGCGVQALHLAEHADHVVATDVNERALWLTRLNLALNEVVGVEPRAGSFFDPVAGERFDLVTTNPPFVISPGTGDRLVYRDSGLPGDQVVERLVRRLPDHLAEGGTGHVLANWLVRRDQPWEERLAGWIGPGCDAWVVQRELADLPTYVELWLKDAGQHPATGRVSVAEYHRRYDTWLSWLEEQGAEAVGFGWINLRRTGTDAPTVRLEDWPYDVEHPVGPEVGGFLDRVAVLRDTDDAALLGARPVTRVDVRQETYGAPGAEDPEEIVLRQQRLLRRARKADTVEAALVGALDGDLTVSQVLDALAELLGRDAEELRTAYLPVVRELVAEGFLTL